MQTSKRYLNEMANMYGLPNELYTMKRGVKRDGELRYDITEIPAMKINGQYNKTKGHIHSTGHQELYIVLQGTAVFLLQNDKEVISIEARRNECVIIPKGYYHNTTNIGMRALTLANWISEKCKSDYKLMEEKCGMAYFVTPKGWIRNTNYPKIPLRHEYALQRQIKDLLFLI